MLDLPRHCNFCKLVLSHNILFYNVAPHACFTHSRHSADSARCICCAHYFNAWKRRPTVPDSRNGRPDRGSHGFNLKSSGEPPTQLRFTGRRGGDYPSGSSPPPGRIAACQREYTASRSSGLKSASASVTKKPQQKMLREFYDLVAHFLEKAPAWATPN